MKIINTGVTRHVILISKYAIKIPRLNYGWRLFLKGLLCNMQEWEFSRMNDKRMAPIFFRIKGGFLIVMARCEPLTKNEFEKINIEHFWGQPTKNSKGYYGDCLIPCEHKQDSFGWYKFNGVNNTLVAIDYGS